MKKTTSPTRSGAKSGKPSPKSSASPKRSSSAASTPKSSASRKTGRIPVRGGSKSGVSARKSPPPPPPPRGDIAEVRALALVAMDAALDKKALAPVLIDVSGMSSYTDFIGIVSGRSDRQVDAIADNIRLAMKSHGRMTLGQEGTGTGRWTLLDFGSVVVHVFYHPVREFYDLESLWIEAPRIPIDVPADSAISEPDTYYGAL